ncbi:uncharacterized protein LOC128995055 isoform X2 [Macrosteles quadrilineatus]|uniref:uncharacterized protein LOC128995055 isoform X2 n=1 Tax=Macrosteles quadrilineatus TaxID=74068 RepID=UPI0023E19542|nr:uncharacterized protein LOC128995055 isoform X2 [Macrosteles quadrilineatus]
MGKTMKTRGLMCGCWPRLCVASHVVCSVLYICAGAVQLIAGIFFLISLPVFKIGSNLWTGGWNVLVGVGGAVFSCVGDITPTKHHVLLYLTISVTVVNIVNLLVLELGEWRLLMPDSVKKLIQQQHLKTLVFYARTTTSISTVIAAVTSFIDAQLMFWWLERCRPAQPLQQHDDTVTDIEYIIPRVNSGSMGKNNAHNMLNQYAHMWVFDTDTVGSSQSDSPYNKLPSAPQFTGSKTVVLKRKARPSTNMCDGVAPEVAVQPVVLVEDTTSDTKRQLPFMTSFSRTPSPVPGDNGDTSSHSSNPAIYECLERLTEPSVYRARLNTAIGTNVDRTSPSVSPRPHSTVMSEQVQYASLMMELNKTIETKFPPSQRHSRRASSRDEASQHKNSTSDAEFSKELEAALQLIQDLESPNTSVNAPDTPSELRAFCDNEPNESVSVGKQCVIHNEGNKTIISLSPQKKYTSIVTILPPENNEPRVRDTTKESNSDTYRSAQKTKDVDRTVVLNNGLGHSTIDSRIIIPSKRCSSLADMNSLPPTNGRASRLIKHKSFKDYSQVEFNNNDIYRDSRNVVARSVSLTEKDTNSLIPNRLRSLKTLLKRKPSQLKLTPELESAIFKQESLAHLTELELIARYNQRKLVERQIEEKAWQKITGNSLTDSSC